jgi:hypothetical protein
VRSGKLYEFRRWPKVDQTAPAGVSDEFPVLPVLPETLLCMELSVGQEVVGLDDLTSVILRDLGATVQILRTTGKGAASCEGSMCRVEDYISALGVQESLRALKDEISIRSGLRPEIRLAWNHARQIAEHCRSLAEENETEISPRDAYLVGLFHELDTLPSLLGWGENTACFNAQAFVRAWPLPECARTYFLEQRAATSWAPWSELVRSAHTILARQQRATSEQSYPRANSLHSPLFFGD